MELIELVLVVGGVLLLAVVGFVAGTAHRRRDARGELPPSASPKGAVSGTAVLEGGAAAPDTDRDADVLGPDLLAEDEVDAEARDVADERVVELARDVPAVEELTLVQRFRVRLKRTSGAFGQTIAGLFRRGLTEEAWDDLEEALISADVGVEATMELVEGMRARAKAEGLTTGEEALALLKEVLRLELGTADRSLARRPDGPSVWLFTGVNGTGKTTTIGKLSKRYADAGETVVLAAADTFRAAASEQLQIWGEPSGSRVVRHQEGADPAAVAFDGWQAAKASGADLLLVDTAGRLQNKRELMEELRKVKKVVERDAGPFDEVLLVLDATVGQNGIAQAKAFQEAVDCTGVVLTKLDGTAKGGIVIAIQRQLELPVKLVGLGEGIEDLADFDPDAFVEALFAEVAQEGEFEDEDLDALAEER